MLQQVVPHLRTHMQHLLHLVGQGEKEKEKKIRRGMLGNVEKYSIWKCPLLKNRLSDFIVYLLKILKNKEKH